MAFDEALASRGEGVLLGKSHLFGGFALKLFPESLAPLQFICTGTVDQLAGALRL